MRNKILIISLFLFSIFLLSSCSNNSLGNAFNFDDNAKLSFVDTNSNERLIYVGNNFLLQKCRSKLVSEGESIICKAGYQNIEKHFIPKDKQRELNLILNEIKKNEKPIPKPLGEVAIIDGEPFNPNIISYFEEQDSTILLFRKEGDGWGSKSCKNKGCTGFCWDYDGRSSSCICNGGEGSCSGRGFIGRIKWVVVGFFSEDDL